MDLSGKWRFESGTPVFTLTHDWKDKSRFTFEREDGEKISFHGHGFIAGGRIVMSWRSTMWVGHGSDESDLVKIDAITNKPIEVHWKGGAPIWMTISN